MKTSLLWLMRASASDITTFTQPNTWNYATSVTWSAGSTSGVPASFTQPNTWSYGITVVPPATDTVTPQAFTQPPSNVWNYSISVTPPGSDPNYPIPMYGNNTWTYAINVVPPASDTTFPVPMYGNNTWNVSFASVAPWTFGGSSSYDSYMTMGSNQVAPNNFHLYGINSGVINISNLSVITTTVISSQQNFWMRPDAEFLLAYGGGGVVTTRRKNDTWYQASMNLGAVTGNAVIMMGFSSDGTRMTFVANGTGGCGIAQQQANGTNNYVTSTGFAAAQVCCISADGAYVGMGRSNGVTMYKWGGTVPAPTLTSLGAPTGSSTLQIRDMAFSPDGIYLAVTSADTGANNGLRIFKRTGDTFASLSVTTPAGAGGYQSCAWSSDGTLLVAVAPNSPQMVVFSHVGDTFTQEATPTNFDSTYGVAWTKDGNTLYTARNSTPYLKKYTRSGNTLTLATDPNQPTSGFNSNARNIYIHPPAFYGP